MRWNPVYLDGSMEEVATPTPNANWTALELQVTHDIFDYLTIVVLVIFFFLGAPFNLAIFFQLSERFSRLSNTDRLKFQLIIGDLLVLFVYSVSKVCWHMTFYWNGGNVLCKLVKFGQELSFQFSSGILACIGLDRLLCVIRPCTPSPRVRKRVTGLIWGAWIYSIVCSSPQLARFTVADVPNTNRQQCVNWWLVWDHRHELTLFLMHLDSTLTVVHLLAIFWLPLAFMCVSYAAIGWQVWRHYHHEVIPGCNSSTLRTEEDPLPSKKSTKSEVRFNLKPEQQESMLLQPTTGRSTASSRLQLRSTDSNRSGRSKSGRSSLHTTTATTLVLITTYTVCWLPYHITAIWPYLFGDSLMSRGVAGLLSLLIVMNSVMNPFIYGFFSRDCCSNPCGNCCADDDDDNDSARGLVRL